MNSLDAAEFFTDGEYVEKALRGVLMGTVAGIDDARAKALGEKLG